MNLNKIILHPNNDFSGFVKGFYKILDDIDPTNVNCLIKLISMHPMKYQTQFLIWDFPESLSNNTLFFDVLTEMRIRCHPIWQGFLNTNGSANMFFDRYLPILGPSNDVVMVSLISTIESIFRDNYETITTPKRQSKIFWHKLVKLIEESTNQEIVVTAFRAATFIYTLMIPKFAKNYKIDWLQSLISASEIPNVVHYQVIEFVFKVKAQKFRYMTLCKNLIKQGITSPNDIVYITRAMVMPNTKKPFYGLKFLFVCATCDKIWSATATAALIEPLIRYQKMEPVNVWVSVFIRRAFIFIGATVLKSQYDRKRMMVLKTLESLYEIGIDWLRAVISKYYSALVYAKILDNMLPSVIINKPDKMFINEVEKVARSAIKMKHYLKSTKIENEKPLQMPPILLQQKKKNVNQNEIKVMIPKMKSKLNMPQVVAPRTANRPRQIDRPLSSRNIKKMIFVSRV